MRLVKIMFIAILSTLTGRFGRNFFRRGVMRLIDNMIRKSLVEAVEKSGGLLAFSKRIGVAHSTVLFWLNGKTKSINSDLWRGRVYPEIESYLAGNLPKMELNMIREKYSDCLSGAFAENRMVSVPVVRESDMMHYDAVVESVEMFAEKFSAENVVFICDVRKKHFGVRLEYCDRSSFYPSGAILLCVADECVRNGDFAVLRMRNVDGLQVCRFFCEGDCISLVSLSDSMKKVEWNYRKDRGRVEWMFPAVWFKVICSGVERKYHGQEIL